MILIQQAMEDHYDDLSENEGTHDEDEFQRALDSEGEELRQEAVAIDTGLRIERGLRNKIERGEELSDEEIFIAVETIGNLYSSLGSVKFNGFGFESFSGKQLTQLEKSKIALEAITNQNADQASTWKAKFERFGAGLSDYASWFSGNMKKLKQEAQEVLDRVKSANDSDFNVAEVTDKRVSLAIQRGTKTPPFKSHGEVLKALETMVDSLKVVSSASKYETLGSSEGSKFDLAKLASDLRGRVVDKDEDSVTYDLNPMKLTGARLRLTIPNTSDSNWFMRSIKANFVVSADTNINYSLVPKATDISAKALSRKECIDLLTSVIDHIDEQERLFKLYYKDAKIGLGDIFKMFFKMGGGLIFVINTFIFRSRMQDMNSRLHYINRACLRGMIAWAASSIK